MVLEIIIEFIVEIDWRIHVSGNSEVREAGAGGEGTVAVSRGCRLVTYLIITVTHFIDLVV